MRQRVAKMTCSEMMSWMRSHDSVVLVSLDFLVSFDSLVSIVSLVSLDFLVSKVYSFPASKSL